uniref:Uncharacterized protein n=1 Tax=Angiostrongylus cantonensis TaxID=6313 RepID=A0A0K0DD34_ANGCA
MNFSECSRSVYLGQEINVVNGLAPDPVDPEETRGRACQRPARRSVQVLPAALFSCLISSVDDQLSTRETTTPCYDNKAIGVISSAAISISEAARLRRVAVDEVHAARDYAILDTRFGCRRPNRRPISFTSRLSGSPFYAGSKFSDSPTARAIPLPPTEWLYGAYNTQPDNASVGSNVGAQVDIETSSTCSSALSLNDVGEVTVLPAELQKSDLRPSSGMRVHPLRLIAAVAAS